MRYRIFFTNGKSTILTENEHQLLLDAITQGEKGTDSIFITDSNTLVNLEQFTHTEKEDTLEGSSGVVKPLTPEQISESKKKEHDAKISSPDAILEGVQEREAEHE